MYQTKETHKSMKTNKLLKIIGSITLALIVLAVVGKKAGWFGKPDAVEVSIEKIERRTIKELITANGKVKPETEVKISSDVSGEIVELYVKEGDEVIENQLLLKIRPDIYLSNLDKMKASLNSAKANLANSKARLAQVSAQFTQAELSFERNKKLWNQGAISKSDYETALSTYQVARAEVTAAEENVNSASYAVQSGEASLNEAQENLTKTSIYAPMSGTVSKLNVEKGERVVGTIQMTGTELLRIANLNKMLITVEVNENDIIKVHLKDTAYIEIDAYLGQQFKGVVTEIANSANSVGESLDQVTNFDVKILILYNSYSHLLPADSSIFYPFRPGMSATVDILSKEKTNVISVPIQAVTTRSDTTTAENNKKTTEFEEETDDSELEKQDDKEYELVFLHIVGKVKVQVVSTGIQDRYNIEIVGGLNEGDEVVTAPYSAISRTLKNGSNVKIVDKDKLSGFSK